MTPVLPVTGNTEHTAPENRAFYPALDGLRASAFIMVFLHHYLLLPWGWAGVDLFFVLSGFLITGILFDTRDDRHRVRNFYVRRTLRIFPLYYGLLLVLLLLWPVFHWQINWKWLVWPAYLGNWMNLRHLYLGSPTQRLADFQPVGSFRHNYVALYLGHFWTLCVEEQFYLLWPFVVFVGRSRRRLLWMCGLSVPMCLAARLLCFKFFPAWLLAQDALAHLTPLRLDALLFGGFVALVLRGRHRNTFLKWSNRLLPLCLILGGIWAFALAPRRMQWLKYPYPTHTLTVGLTLIDLLGALLLLNAVQPGNWLASLLRVRPLRWLGRLSYGAYVFHDLPHPLYTEFCARHFGPSPVPIAVLAFVATLLLAWASFRFFEAPFLNLKERYTLRG